MKKCLGFHRQTERHVVYNIQLRYYYSRIGLAILGLLKQQRQSGCFFRHVLFRSSLAQLIIYAFRWCDQCSILSFGQQVRGIASNLIVDVVVVEEIAESSWNDMDMAMLNCLTGWNVRVLWR